MAGELCDGLKARIPRWKAQLWQVFEGQYEPFSVAALLRYLRELAAYLHAAGLEQLSRDVVSCAGRLANRTEQTPEAMDRSVRALLADLELQADLVDDPGPELPWIIHVQPGTGFFASGLDLSLVFQSLAGLGQLEVYPDTTLCPPWDQFDPLQSHLRWDLVLVTSQGRERIQDCLDFLASEPDMLVRLEENPDLERLQALRLANTVAPIPANPVPGPGNPAGYQRRASDRPAAGPEAGPGGKAQAPSIRMSIDRLDRIIDHVGELVTADGKLKNIASRVADPALTAAAEEIERLTIMLRDASMGLRMQPVGSLFSRFSRLVRDLCQSLGKDANLVLEGEETELDRNILERLHDPLVHLIRNSLDHGLEPAQERLAAGKPAQGTICLRAFQQGSEVYIQVQDDGGGIDPDKVLAKAVERQLVRPDAVLEHSQILDLVFLPGFSTAAVVSDVSGRGVGMDVVKSNVESLRGQVAIDSLKGEGCSITLRFPLTMAIIDGLIVEVGGDRFILPLDPVEECLDLEKYGDGGKLLAEFRRGTQGLYYNLRGEGVPLFSLATLLAPGCPAGTKMIVVDDYQGDRVALAVDRIAGRQQVVIKPLGPLHRNRRELSGASILGDGSIALVLDLPNVMRRLQESALAGKNVALE